MNLSVTMYVTIEFASFAHWSFGDSDDSDLANCYILSRVVEDVVPYLSNGIESTFL